MKRIAVLIAAFCVATSLRAHHGKDFLLVESYELPPVRELYVVSSEQFLFRHSDVTFRDEPSLLFGTTDRLAAEVHLHIEKEPGAHASVEAVAPALHIRLFDSGRFHLGLSAEYEFGRGDATRDAAAIAIIAGHTVGDGAMVANLGVEHTSEHAATPLYQLGYRADLEAQSSWGVEAAGMVRHGEEHQVILGTYHELMPHVTIKIGAGLTIGQGRPSAVIRSGVVLRLR